jgi:hypothetical protein
MRAAFAATGATAAEEVVVAGAQAATESNKPPAAAHFNQRDDEAETRVMASSWSRFPVIWEGEPPQPIPSGHNSVSGPRIAPLNAGASSERR